MSARLLLNRAYIMIGVAAIVMLATLLGGLALRSRHARSDSKSTTTTTAPPAANSSSSSQRP